MHIEMLTFSADPRRALVRGKVYKVGRGEGEVSKEDAESLIEYGAARPIAAKDIKKHHAPPSTERIEG